MTTGSLFKRALTQPLVGIVLSAAAAGLIASAWIENYGSLTHSSTTIQEAVTAVLLFAAVLLSDHFPIHLRYSTKILMGTVPLYLIAVLLAPPVAALTTFVALFIGEWMMRKARASLISDMATRSGRWTFISFAGSTVAHIVAPSLWAHLVLLAVAGVIMAAGDILLAPLQVCPITGERPLKVVIDLARTAGLPEAGQYGLGFIGALLALHDPWAPALLLVPIALLYTAAKQRMELHESTKRLLESMADTVDQRDPYTHNHSLRVTVWTTKLLRELNIVGPEAQLIVTAARVHDIGKMSIPDEILHKHEQLTPEEWRIMEAHPRIGADMLTNYPAFARGASIVRGHHERFDGNGYPDGLVGTDIPFGARLLAVCDSFDAMVSDRPYRMGMSYQRAAEILRSGAGSQWDAQLVDAFLRLIEPELATESVGEPVQVVSPVTV